MFERFTKAARQVAIGAQAEARRLDHDHIGTEHILLAMLAAPDSASGGLLIRHGLTHQAATDAVLRLLKEDDDLDADVLSEIGIDLNAVKEKVEEAFGPARSTGRSAPAARRWGTSPSPTGPRRCWSSPSARRSTSSTATSPTATSCSACSANATASAPASSPRRTSTSPPSAARSSQPSADPPPYRSSTGGTARGARRPSVRTRATSSANANGFTRQSSRDSPSTRSRTRPAAVSMGIRVAARLATISRQTSSPCSSGRSRSSATTSWSTYPAGSTASWPSWTTSTAIACSRSPCAMASASCSSSSTMSTRMQTSRGRHGEPRGVERE